MKKVSAIFLSLVICICQLSVRADTNGVDLSETTVIENTENTEVSEVTEDIPIEERDTEELEHKEDIEGEEEDVENTETVENTSTTEETSTEIKEVIKENSYNTMDSMQLESNVMSVGSSSSFDITLQQDTDGYGSVQLDWSGYDYKDKNFKAYKSSDGVNYESVGIDYKSVNNIRLLQIYPRNNARNQLKTWLVSNGYGKGIISVDSVYINNFNINPNGYLKDYSGNYKYDVIFFGTWDYNYAKDLNYSSYKATEDYIKTGRGCIFGHDTIVNNYFNYPYFRKLASYTGVRIADNNKAFFFTDDVVIQRKGLFTTYPWYLGEPGDHLVVGTTHSLGQVVNDGNCWLAFPNGGSVTVNGEYAPSYLTTKNNCAMIQVGHANGTSTHDEQMVLANLVFYVNQLCFNTYTMKDSSAQDVAKPSKVTPSLENGKITFSAVDYGSTYSYYVESYSKNDTTSTGLIDRSVTKNVSVKTGIKYYKYYYTNDPNGVTINSSTGTLTSSSTINYNSGYKYISVAAVDGSKNIGETTTVALLSKVTFNPNGGTVNTTSKEVNCNSNIGDLPIPIRKGYEFLGWYTDATNGANVTSSYIVTQSDITLYAHWRYSLVNVYLPQEIIGDKNGNSEFLVKTDILVGTITVETSEGFYYKQEGKENVYAKISTKGNNKLTKENSSIKYCITSDGLSAGSWTGNFNIKINIGG